MQITASEGTEAFSFNVQYKIIIKSILRKMYWFQCKHQYTSILKLPSIPLSQNSTHTLVDVHLLHSNSSIAISSLLVFFVHSFIWFLISHIQIQCVHLFCSSIRCIALLGFYIWFESNERRGREAVSIFFFISPFLRLCLISNWIFIKLHFLHCNFKMVF